MILAYLVAEALSVGYIDWIGGICWQGCKVCDTADCTESSVGILVVTYGICIILLGSYQSPGEMANASMRSRFWRSESHKVRFWVLQTPITASFRGGDGGS